MGVAQQIVFLLFCVSMAFGQRIPQAFFEPVPITNAQLQRIATLDSIEEKTQEQREELSNLFAQTQAYEQSYSALAALVSDFPDHFEYNFLLGGISGILASELPRTKSLPYVRTMKSAFEKAASINPNSLKTQLILLELYTGLPWILGGSNKKAEEVVEIIKSLSVVEGFLAEGYFYRAIKKNKVALIAYLNAINEIKDCDTLTIQQNVSRYRLAVLAFYLQKDVVKSECLFSDYVTRHTPEDPFPKSFARYYLGKISNTDSFDTKMESTLNEYDKLTFWIQNNFK